MLIDFDAKNPKERLPADELEKVKTFMRTSYHTRLGYESISGLGYHIVVPFVLPEGPEVNPLREYVLSRASWNPGMPDYIGQAAAMVHMATDGHRRARQDERLSAEQAEAYDHHDQRRCACSLR